MEGERGRERVENKEIINKDLWFATIQREGVIYRHHIRVHYYRLQLEHIESTYGLEKEKNRKTKKEKIEKRKKEKNGKRNAPPIDARGLAVSGLCRDRVFLPK